MAQFLFSYGTLQLDAVQMATFGRLLVGKPDVLTGFEEASLEIEDQTVISISGKATHTIARFTGNASDTISFNPEYTRGCTLTAGIRPRA